MENGGEGGVRLGEQFGAGEVAELTGLLQVGFEREVAVEAVVPQCPEPFVST
ncbi:hypothetical protein AB0H36_46970 [Kribbella sp. NPDC050820]|uniref:hypothetical protein n=1 Tax=Kribbella sp. NPDC050820 TaxID=3155408 RepID=UPI0033BFD587